MHDRAFLDAILWVQEEGSEELPHGIKLCEAIMNLAFLDDFGVNLSGLGAAKDSLDHKGVDDNLVWAAGPCTGDAPK